MPTPLVIFVELVGGGAALLCAEDLEADGHGVGEDSGGGRGAGVVEGGDGGSRWWEDFDHVSRRRRLGLGLWRALR